MIKINDHIYSSEYGYFIKEHDQWNFVSSDKPLTVSNIEYILKNLKELNYEI